VKKFEMKFQRAGGFQNTSTSHLPRCLFFPQASILPYLEIFESQVRSRFQNGSRARLPDSFLPPSFFLTPLLFRVFSCPNAREIPTFLLVEELGEREKRWRQLDCRTLLIFVANMRLEKFLKGKEGEKEEREREREP